MANKYMKRHVILLVIKEMEIKTILSYRILLNQLTQYNTRSRIVPKPCVLTWHYRLNCIPYQGSQVEALTPNVTVFVDVAWKEVIPVK